MVRDWQRGRPSSLRRSKLGAASADCLGGIGSAKLTHLEKAQGSPNYLPYFCSKDILLATDFVMPSSSYRVLSLVAVHARNHTLFIPSWTCPAGAPTSKEKSHGYSAESIDQNDRLPSFYVGIT
jgi:hypothetical protein